MGSAIELVYENFDKYNANMANLRDYYVEQIKNRVSDIRINGDEKNRLPGNSNISFKNVEGECLLLNLDCKGICASTGSACTSGSSAPSHVLVALGISEEYLQGTLRVTFGKENTKEDVDYLVESVVETIEKLRNSNNRYNV